MMSGRVHVKGDASQSAGATAHGGLLVIDGDASARCGNFDEGRGYRREGFDRADERVHGAIGEPRGARRCWGCAGDSIYEARLFVRGSVKSLGADCVAKEMRAEHLAVLGDLLKAAGVEGVSPGEFTRYGSGRSLYNFHVDNAGAY